MRMLVDKDIDNLKAVLSALLQEINELKDDENCCLGCGCAKCDRRSSIYNTISDLGE